MFGRVFFFFFLGCEGKVCCIGQAMPDYLIKEIRIYIPGRNDFVA